MRSITHLSIVALLAVSAMAQELPDAPTPQTKTYGKALWIATGLNAAAKVTDITQTCIVLGMPGGHEHWLPTQSCGGIAAFNAAGFAASTFVSWYLNRHGHHRLALAMQYLSFGGNVAGIAYTRAHWHVAGAPSTKVAPQ